MDVIGVTNQAEPETAPADSAPSVYPNPTSRRVAIAAWSVFDLAMTIFSINIISRYFSQWVSEDNHQPDIVYSGTFSVSLAIVAFSSPALGVISDRAGKRLPYLFVVTALCVIATAAIGFANNLWLGLALFVVANYAYQSTQVFYNALLAGLSTPASRGRISGIGQAIGYTGALIGVFATAPFLAKLTDANGKVVTDSDGNALIQHISAFVPTAILVGVFALPIFFFVREPQTKRVVARQSLGQTLRQSFGQLIRSLRHARQYPNLFRFLIARIFYADAANTVVAFMSIYAANAIHMSDSQITLVLAVGIVSSIGGAFSFGFVADRLGPKRALYIVLGLWAVAMISAAVTQEKTLFFFIAALVGFSLGALRTSDRTFLITVTPPAMLGEAFGLYGVVGEFSSILGPLLWGLITLALDSTGDFKYRAAVTSLLVLLIIGWFLLRTAKDEQPTVRSEQ